MVIGHAAFLWRVVQGHQPGIEEGRRLGHRHRLQAHPDVGPQVRRDVVGGSEGRRFQHTHDVQRQKLQGITLWAQIASLHHLSIWTRRLANLATSSCSYCEFKNEFNVPRSSTSSVQFKNKLKQSNPHLHIIQPRNLPACWQKKLSLFRPSVWIVFND